MAEYRLARRAAEDLREIADYGYAHFGHAQSDRYGALLKRRFALLAERPLLFPAVDHIRSGYRRSVCGAHSIYYRMDGTGVEIIRILKHQDTGREFE